MGIKGAPLLLGALAALSVLDAIAKELIADYSISQVLWARYVFFVVALMVISKPRRWLSALKTQHPRLQIVRSLMPIGVGGGLVLGLRELPLAETTAILYVAPLVVVVVSVAWLREQVTTAIVGGLILGFVGMLVVTRPGAAVFGWPVAYPLAAAGFLAGYHIMTRMVRGDSLATSVAYTALTGTVVTSTVVAFHWVTPTWQAWALFAVSGGLHALGQLMMIRAFTLSEASALAPFNYAQIPMAAALGLIVFGDLPDAVTIGGMVMIAGAGLWVWRQRASAPG